MFDYGKFQAFAATVAAAIMLSTVSIGAAIAPAAGLAQAPAVHATAAIA